MKKQDKIKAIIFQAINKYPTHYWRAYREAKSLFYSEFGCVENEREWLRFIDKLVNILDDRILSHSENIDEINHPKRLINICEECYIKNYINSKFKGGVNA